MTKVLFWLGALFAIFQVAYPVFVQKPVQVVSSTPSAVPSSVRSVSAMEPNEAF